MSTVTDSANKRTDPSPTTISRIAVGVDGRPVGNDAVALGAMLAKATHAELMLVAVHPEPPVVLPEEMNWKSLELQAATLLREIRDACAPCAIAVAPVGYAEELTGPVSRIGLAYDATSESDVSLSAATAAAAAAAGAARLGVPLHLYHAMHAISRDPSRQEFGSPAARRSLHR